MLIIVLTLLAFAVFQRKSRMQEEIWHFIDTTTSIEVLNVRIRKWFRIDG
jgi:hypothetical protein